jgi:hypothetical protein
MHSKRITEANQSYQKLKKLKILLQREKKKNPKPETSHTKPQKKSPKVYP